MSKRFFAFGCSFTNYSWPTWADVVGCSLKEQGYEYYNYGSSGSGNYYMYASLTAADLKHRFTDDDIIMVMWSNWSREDRFLLNYWHNNVRGCCTKEGNILTASHGSHRFKSDWTERYWSLENDIVKNILAIEHSRKLYNIDYEDTILFFESAPKHTHPDDIEDPAQRLFEKYINLSGSITDNWEPGYHDASVYPNGNLSADLKNERGHPLPNHHMHYVKTYIQPKFPHLDLCNESATSMCRTFQRKLVDAKKRLPDTWHDETANAWQSLQKQILDGDYLTLWDDDMFENLLNNFKF